MSESPNPSPEELQRKLADFMKAHFGDKVSFTTVTQPDVVEDGPGEEAPPAGHPAFSFDYKPRDIKAHLDRFVIKQDDAKKVLSIAVCDHYNHINHLRQLAAGDAAAARELEYSKQNVILVGPTGVGKTYLVKHIADLIGVPFVKADATKFSETGYVGGDVEDLVRELVQKADDDIELAQYGIVYIDEIDKIASSSQSHGRDVSGRGVQTTLLKLMEETEVPIRNPMDIQSQLQAAFEFQRRGGKAKRETINTRNILFIVSGAFDRLRDIVHRRIQHSHIGFAAEPIKPVMDTELFRYVSTRDFIDFGFEPEFIGRLPVRVVCEELTEDDLFEIMKRSEGSVIRQYERAFRAYGIEAAFDDDALRLIARHAAPEKTGARGLLTICEKILRDFKYELPGAGVRSFNIDVALVENPAVKLRDLISAGRSQLQEDLALEARTYAADYSQKTGLQIAFTDDAIARLVERAAAGRVSIRTICDQLFKDYEFGLRLIQKNNRQSSFLLPAEAIENPDKFLSDWVLKSYQQEDGPPGSRGIVQSQ